MRCKNYSQCGHRTPSPTGMKCWERWQLCGACAVKEYPEEYPKIKLIQHNHVFWSRGRLTSQPPQSADTSAGTTFKRRRYLWKREPHTKPPDAPKRGRYAWPYSEKYNGQKGTKDSMLASAVMTSAVGVANSSAVRQRHPTFATVSCVVRRLRGMKRNKKEPLNGRKVAPNFWNSAYH